MKFHGEYIPLISENTSLFLAFNESLTCFLLHTIVIKLIFFVIILVENETSEFLPRTQGHNNSTNV